jgi:hypothetical protein
MTQNNPPLGRRPTKFTAERIELIRNLVERGTSRDEIARLLNVSLGSLQVTCSKLGISLRRPVAENGWRRREHRNSGVRYNPTGRTNTALRRSDETEHFSHAAVPEHVRSSSENASDPVHFAFTIRYKDEERVTDLALTSPMIARMAAEAHFRNMRIHELVGDLITATLHKNLVQQVLDTEPR